MLGKSLIIGRIYGIPVKIHFSFLIIIPLLAFVFGNSIQLLARTAGVPFETLLLNPYISGLIMALALFVSVGLHELAHSRVAQKQGLEINSITLMLLGGVAQIEEGLEDPKKELVIAIAGPMASLVIGSVLLLVFTFYPAEFFPDLRLIGLYLGQLNIFLAVFNLLPAFPTDGGRIFRAILVRWFSYLDATRVATGLGRVMAFLLGLFGLFSGNFILIFIAIFIFMGASQEYQQTLLRTGLSDLRVRDLMTEEVSVVDENTTVDELLQKFLAELHSGYPVVTDGELTGCVTVKDTNQVEASQRGNYRVKDIMSRDIKDVNPDTPLARALSELSRNDIGRLMVVEDGKLVGIITRSDIMKGFQLQKLQQDMKLEKT